MHCLKLAVSRQCMKFCNVTQQIIIIIIIIIIITTTTTTIKFVPHLPSERPAYSWCTEKQSLVILRMMRNTSRSCVDKKLTLATKVSNCIFAYIKLNLQKSTVHRMTWQNSYVWTCPATLNNVLGAEYTCYYCSSTLTTTSVATLHVRYAIPLRHQRIDTLQGVTYIFASIPDCQYLVSTV